MRNQKSSPGIISEMEDFRIMKHELEKLKIPQQTAYINKEQAKIILSNLIVTDY